MPVLAGFPVRCSKTGRAREGASSLQGLRPDRIASRALKVFLDESGTEVNVNLYQG